MEILLPLLLTEPSSLNVGDRNLIFDPLGRPTITAGSDHYFRTWCLYFRPSIRQYLAKSRKTKQFSSEISDRYWRYCGSGRGDH